MIDIIDQHVTIEIVGHKPDPRQKPPWNYGDLVSGRITWGAFRNSRWSNLVNENLTP